MRHYVTSQVTRGPFNPPPLCRHKRQKANTLQHQIPSVGCKRTTRQLQLQCLALTAPLCRSTIAAPGLPAFSSARPGPSRHSGAAPAVPPGADDSHGPRPLSEPHRGHGGTMQAYPRGPRPVASVARPGRPSGAPGSRGALFCSALQSGRPELICKYCSLRMPTTMLFPTSPMRHRRPRASGLQFLNTSTRTAGRTIPTAPASTCSQMTSWNKSAWT